MAKYNVNCNGAKISSDSMIGIARIIANSSDAERVREVYKNTTGRYPSAHQMEMI